MVTMTTQLCTLVLLLVSFQATGRADKETQSCKIMCSKSTRLSDFVADMVCRQLGSTGQEGVKSAERLICNCTKGETLSCTTSIPSACNHSQDLAVMCQSYNISTTVATTCGNDSATALGVIIGLLVFLLVAIVTGWIFTYVAMKKKISNKLGHDDTSTRQCSSQDLRQLTNLVYDGTTAQPQPLANYSSLGPTYELVEANEGVGQVEANEGVELVDDNEGVGPIEANEGVVHEYDIIKYTKQSTGQGKVAASGTSGHVPDGDYNLLAHGASSLQEQGNDGQEHIYNVLGQDLSTGRENTDPLNYEIPIPKTLPPNY